jgi:hypothetical protein
MLENALFTMCELKFYACGSMQSQTGVVSGRPSNVASKVLERDHMGS